MLPQFKVVVNVCFQSSLKRIRGTKGGTAQSIENTMFFRYRSLFHLKSENSYIEKTYTLREVIYIFIYIGVVIFGGNGREQGMNYILKWQFFIINWLDFGNFVFFVFHNANAIYCVPCYACFLCSLVRIALYKAFSLCPCEESRAVEAAI